MDTTHKVSSSQQQQHQQQQRGGVNHRPYALVGGLLVLYLLMVAMWLLSDLGGPAGSSTTPWSNTGPSEAVRASGRVWTPHRQRRYNVQSEGEWQAATMADAGVVTTNNTTTSTNSGTAWRGVAVVRWETQDAEWMHVVFRAPQSTEPRLWMRVSAVRLLSSWDKNQDNAKDTDARWRVISSCQHVWLPLSSDPVRSRRRLLQRLVQPLVSLSLTDDEASNPDESDDARNIEEDPAEPPTTPTTIQHPGWLPVELRAAMDACRRYPPSRWAYAVLEALPPLTLVGATTSPPEPPIPVLRGCRRQQQVGNGHCDSECNEPEFDWDGGDCCAPTRRRGVRAARGGVTPPPSPQPGECKTGPEVLLLHSAGWDGHPVSGFSDNTPAVIDAVLERNLWGVLPWYLRDVARHTIFNSHDTVTRGWTDPELQRAYYQRALAVVRGGGVVFAMSMAGLVLAGACLHQGLCEPVRWYNVGVPLLGARTTELAYPLHRQHVGGGNTAMRLNETGVQSMRPSMPGLGDGTLARLVKDKGLVLGAACGVSAFGSGGGGWAAVELAAMTVLAHAHVEDPDSDANTNTNRRHAWQVSSDGFVTERECVGAFPTEQFDGTTPLARWVLLPANHQELAGVLSDPQAMPHVIQWYQHVLGLHFKRRP